jgi:hypothetical protein
MQVKEEPFRLTNTNPVISEADGVALTWTDVWTYQVPNGTALILKPNHSFAAYLEDSSPAEVGDASCRIKIEKRDSSKSDTLIVYGPALYVSSKEFQYQQKMARLKVPAAGVVVNEREYLIISVYDDATGDSSDSYFELHIAQLRKTLGA